MKNRLPHCDIILYARSSLTNLNECIYSIINNTCNYSYILHIIAKSSDNHTKAYLENCSRQNSQVIVHQSKEELETIETFNRAISLGSSPYVLLIDSDVIVTHFWLDRMLSCAESDPMIGAVSPFANRALDISIDMPSGSNFVSMNSYLKRIPTNKYPDIITRDGFCTLFRRKILNEICCFDNSFHDAYYSRLDLSMRFLSRGYRTVVAPDVYVCCLKTYRIPVQNNASPKSQKMFHQKWEKQYRNQIHLNTTTNSIKKYRDFFSVEKQWAPGPCLRQTYRQARARFQRLDYFGVLKEIISGIRKLPFAKREVVTPEMVSKFSNPDRLRVTYILPALTIAGGVLSVVQLVNELILLGVEARIVALRDYPEVYNWKFLFRPIIFKNVSELLKNFPKTDVGVATHFSTASWVAKLVDMKRVKTSFYFLQDYESWFFPKSDERSQAIVRKSYGLISNKVVKSEWLKQLIKNDGYTARKIRLGMDLLTFYPRDINKKEYPVLLAMARPRTPRRGFDTLIKALTLVKQKVAKLEIVLFGDDLYYYSIPFEFKDKKIISDQASLAKLYSKADIFIDSSDFQGFGRTALEAMACGTACVLTNVGGVAEYARNEKNCLLVPPKEPELLAAAIIKLIKSKKLQEKIISAGLKTVKDYCHKIEARQTYDYIKESIGRLYNKGSSN